MSVWFLTILIPLKLLLITLIFDSFYFHLQRYRKGFYQLILKHSSHSSWQLIKNGYTQSIQISHTSVLTSFIIILHLKINEKSRNILILQDAISPEDYRKIFVALKITAYDKNA